VETIRAKLPELPEARRNRFVAEYGLPLYDANLLTSSKAMADYFEECLKTEEYKKLPPGKGAKEVSNWLLGEVSRIMNAYNIDIVDFRKKVGPERLVRLSVLNSQGAVNTSIAKSVLEEMFGTGKPADDIIAEQGLSQITDTQEIEAVVSQVVTANAQAVADYKAGKTQALKFLIGQVMKATRGRTNPNLAQELLTKKLEEEEEEE
jgi:aspartyl-tRNA(Asn)/glutamyl-tRNA(Gln) amidotransferase subunit B